MISLIERRIAEGATDLSRTISNSEVSTFLQCERKHYYNYLQLLQPKTQGPALVRGTIGHEALEAYYKVIQETQDEPVGPDIEVAERAAQDVLLGYLHNADVDKAMVADLMTLLQRYWKYYTPREWYILGVEAVYEIPVKDEWNFIAVLDLIVRLPDGTIVIVDHKFVYDFYQDSVLEMNSQIPKYLGTVRYNGVKAEYAILNQIRYRMKKGGNTDDELFRRSALHPPNAEVRQYMSEHFKLSDRIMKRRALDPAEQESEAVRVANQMICKNCSFEPICKSEAMGGNTELMRSLDYQPKFNPKLELLGASEE